jgi:glutamate formiminotransferase
MTARVLEAVPNFSEGRDASVVRAIVDAMAAAGAEVLDWSADPDHHRAVVTVVGEPGTVEAAAFAGARVAVERIDLRRHRGVHPRVGALDVLPFVPLLGLTLDDARAAARRTGERIARELDVPILYYGAASDPPGRSLAAVRRGGYEGLVAGWPADRGPDVLPPGWPHPGAHPRAGATCVGARNVLLAWNVTLEDVTLEAARAIAREIRASDGGMVGVRALALELPSRGSIQVSMNIEDPEATSPMDVFRAIERRAAAAGGRVAGTEVVGMVPDALLWTAAADRLGLDPSDRARMLTRRLLEYLAAQGRDRPPPVPRGE